MTIRKKFDEFVAENGSEPRYASVSIIWNDDNKREDGYIISMVTDEETERLDEWIFFHCDSVADIESMTKKGCEDFRVISSSVEFTNNI